MSIKNNAIFFLCMLKDHYVLGSCITAYCHKLYLKKINKRIDMVIMCDNYIYKKYNSTLKLYFDRVINIKLNTFNFKNTYNPSKKYNWVKHSLTKWESLKFTEYNKILFLDIDMLPNNKQFYDIFDFNTPAFRRYRHKTDKNYKCINNHSFKINFKGSFNEYINNYIDIYGSLDAGMVLFKPDLNLYNDYLKFINNEFKNGLYSAYSDPDESSLFYFLINQKIPLYNICIDYTVIPWENYEYNKTAKSYNFLSMVKPWLKIKFLSWKEETIWRDLYDSMPKLGKVKNIFKKELLKNYFNFLDLNIKKQDRFYNTKYIKKYPNILKKIKKSKNKFSEIIRIEKKFDFKDYGLLNRKKNSIKNIYPISN